MAKPFLTDEARRAFTAAVRDVEAVSSAELVVAVRARSASYLHAGLLAGIAVGVAALAFLLFSHQVFGILWLVLDPVLAGALGALAASRSTAVRRLLTRPADRRRQAETAARALFVEKRVHGTAGRTGILFYVSVLEREAVVVTDVGLEALTVTESWQRIVAALERAVRQGEDGLQVAERLKTLAACLAPALPCAPDDVDELPDEVCE